MLLAGVGVGSFLLGAVVFCSIGKWRGRSVKKADLEAEIEREQLREAHSEAVYQE
jgi:hypothetical protein